MKTIFYLLIVFSILSCSNNTHSLKEIQDKNIVTAKSLFENFNRHDWKSMASLYNDTAQFKDPSFGNSVIQQTHQQIIEKYVGLNELFLDITDSVESIYASGERTVIVEFVSKGTAPDSSILRLPICSILTIVNGKITKDFTYYDNSNN